MKLLICTQKVDATDDNLGFFIEWIKEFAQNVEQVTIICLYKGTYTLPDNVTVHSLGKEVRESRLQYVTRFYRYIWRKRKNYDAVFVHMNQIYVLLGAWFWRLWGKRVALWYTHKSVTWGVHGALWLVHAVYTASTKSFRIASSKVHVMGHGIDTNTFTPAPSPNREQLEIVTDGRIDPIKNIHTMIEALHLVKEKGVSFRMRIAGSPSMGNETYVQRLKTLVRRYGLEKDVAFIGSLPFREIPELYRSAHMYLNLSNTGSVDKTVLQAMASGLIPIVGNPAFTDILENTYLVSLEPEIIAARIRELSQSPVDPSLREYVIKTHNLANLTSRLVTAMDRL